jgi:protein TonB
VTSTVVASALSAAPESTDESPASTVASAPLSGGTVESPAASSPPEDDPPELPLDPEPDPDPDPDPDPEPLEPVLAPELEPDPELDPDPDAAPELPAPDPESSLPMPDMLPTSLPVAQCTSVHAARIASGRHFEPSRDRIVLRPRSARGAVSSRRIGVSLPVGMGKPRFSRTGPTGKHA